MKQRRIHAVALAGLVVLSSVLPAPASAEERVPANAFDIWTSTRALEDSKIYSALVPVLEVLLGQRTAVSPAGPPKATEPPLNDPEGVVYLLDDLAEVYTVGLIDFEKALAYNKRAREALEGLVAQGLANVPVSDYFNKRRSLYYYFYPVTSKPNSGDVRPLESDLPETLFFNQERRATSFSPQFLAAVRQADLDALRSRVLSRQAYLHRKLGISADGGVPPSPSTGTEELAFLAKILEKHPAYNPYYRHYFLAHRTWENYLLGNVIDFVAFVNTCKEALARSARERAPHDGDSHRLLLYWLSYAYLATGDLKEGTYYSREFLRALDRADDMERELGRKRRAIMGKAVEEKRRAWETLGIVIMLVGQFASMGMSVHGMLTAQAAASSFQQGVYTSMQQLLAAQQAAQQTIQNVVQQTLITANASFLFTQTVSQVAARLPEGKGVEDLRRLAAGLSPLALQVARYLNKFEQVEFYARLAGAYERLEDLPRAIRFVREALSIIEAQRSTIGTEVQRINFGRIKEELYQQIVRLLIRAEQPDAAFEYVERAKARALLDLLAGKGSLELATQEETAAFAAALRRRDEIAALLEQTRPSTDQVAALAAREAELEVPRPGDQERPQNLRHEGARMLGEARTILASEAAALSKGDQSIIEYYLSDRELHIFVLDAGRLSVATQRIERERLFELLKRFREGVATPAGAERTGKDPAEALYDVLIRPIQRHLTKKRLTIIPHGWLYYIPFQALRANGHYLVEEYAVTYAPSASIMRLGLARGMGRRRESVLVFANADLGEGRYKLPAAEQEGKFVARSFPEARLLVGREATADRFMSLAPDFDVIHVATHAVFDHEDPLRSAILLSSGGPSEARVSARDFYRLRLKASLVVLSACESGLSGVVTGDELVGLVRGVMYSGAASMVASLWSVEDQSTAYTMQVFYQQMRTLPKDLALQRAQLETMKRFPAPFYWAPFVLFGDYQ